MVVRPWAGNWVKPSLAKPGSLPAMAREYTSAALTWAMDMPSPMNRNTYLALSACWAKSEADRKANTRAKAEMRKRRFMAILLAGSLKGFC